MTAKTPEQLQEELEKEIREMGDVKRQTRMYLMLMALNQNLFVLAKKVEEALAEKSSIIRP